MYFGKTEIIWHKNCKSYISCRKPPKSCNKCFKRAKMNNSVIFSTFDVLEILAYYLIQKNEYRQILVKKAKICRFEDKTVRLMLRPTTQVKFVCKQRNFKFLEHFTNSELTNLLWKSLRSTKKNWSNNSKTVKFNIFMK